MVETLNDRMNRRELLRKTATVGAAVLGGAATATGLVAAFPFEVGDRVQVSGYSATTFEHCCENDLTCATATRDQGDAGQIIGECEMSNPYTRYQILWDTKESDQYYMSWITDDEIEAE